MDDGLVNWKASLAASLFAVDRESLVLVRDEDTDRIAAVYRETKLLLACVYIQVDATSNSYTSVIS